MHVCVWIDYKALRCIMITPKHTPEDYICVLKVSLEKLKFDFTRMGVWEDNKA